MLTDPQVATKTLKNCDEHKRLMCKISFSPLITHILKLVFINTIDRIDQTLWRMTADSSTVRNIKNFVSKRARILLYSDDIDSIDYFHAIYMCHAVIHVGVKICITFFAWIDEGDIETDQTVLIIMSHL